jgi:hypothetical protein
VELATGGKPLGGMLLGFRDESFEVGDWKKGTFFISAMVLQCSCNLKWRFMLVYGRQITVDRRSSWEN